MRVPSTPPVIEEGTGNGALFFCLSGCAMVFPIAFRADLIAGLPKSRTLRFCALEYRERWNAGCGCPWGEIKEEAPAAGRRSEEHTSELQSLMRNSYAVFC